MAALRLGDLPANADGWGPSSVPEHLRELPYAPYGRGDRLGRSADWSSNGYNKGYAGKSSYGGVTVFNFEAEKEKLERTKAPGFKEKLMPKKKAQDKFRWAYWRRDIPVVNYGPSVEPRPNWESLETIQMERLAALHYECEEEGETLVAAGSLEPYNKAFDRAEPRRHHAAALCVRRGRRLLLRHAPGHAHGLPALALPLGLPRHEAQRADLAGQAGQRGGDADELGDVPGAGAQRPGEHQRVPEARGGEHAAQLHLLADGPGPEARAQAGGEAPLPSRGRQHSDRRDGVLLPPLADRVAPRGRALRRGRVDGPGGEGPCLLRALNEFDSRVSGAVFRQKLENQRSAVLANEMK